MDALIGKIEKAKPFFEKVSRNKYLKAIRDGFMSASSTILKYLHVTCLCTKHFWILLA
mgnify:CR=1 FL=1